MSWIPGLDFFRIVFLIDVAAADRLYAHPAESNAAATALVSHQSHREYRYVRG